MVFVRDQRDPEEMMQPAALHAEDVGDVEEHKTDRNPIIEDYAECEDNQGDKIESTRMYLKSAPYGNKCRQKNHNNKGDGAA